MYKHYLTILAVGAFIVNKKGEILLVKKSSTHTVDANLWTIPGGKVELNEPIIDALKREVKEEVGLTVKTYRWFDEHVFESQGFVYHAQHFICTVSDPVTILLEPLLLDYAFVTKDKVSSFELNPQVAKRISEVFTNHL